MHSHSKFNFRVRTFLKLQDSFTCINLILLPFLRFWDERKFSSDRSRSRKIFLNNTFLIFNQQFLRATPKLNYLNKSTQHFPKYFQEKPILTEKQFDDQDFLMKLLH